MGGREMTELGLGTESVQRGNARELCREMRVNELHLEMKCVNA